MEKLESTYHIENTQKRVESLIDLYPIARSKGGGAKSHSDLLIPKGERGTLYKYTNKLNGTVSYGVLFDKYPPRKDKENFYYCGVGVYRPNMDTIKFIDQVSNIDMFCNNYRALRVWDNTK